MQSAELVEKAQVDKVGLKFGWVNHERDDPDERI